MANRQVDLTKSEFKAIQLALLEKKGLKDAVASLPGEGEEFLKKFDLAPNCLLCGKPRVKFNDDGEVEGIVDHPRCNTRLARIEERMRSKKAL